MILQKKLITILGTIRNLRNNVNFNNRKCNHVGIIEQKEKTKLRLGILQR